MTPRPRTGTSRYEPTTDDGIERDKRSSILHLRDTVYRANNLEPVRVDRSLKTTNMTEARDRAPRFCARVQRSHAYVSCGRFIMLGSSGAGMGPAQRQMKPG